MKKLLLALTLMWIVSSFISIPAYAKDWFDLTPDGGRRSGGGSWSGSLPDINPDLEDLNDIPGQGPDRSNVPNANSDVEQLLPGEDIRAYTARTNPESSRKIYQNNKIYSPDQEHVGDWDLDGIPDNKREDRIYGVDAPDPDPDPDPDPEFVGEETTVEETTVEESTAEETTASRADNMSSKDEGGSGPGPGLLLIAIVGGILLYRHRNRRRDNSSPSGGVSGLEAACAVLLPPLGVFLKIGIGKHFWINVLLTVLGYVPGVVHAVWILMKSKESTGSHYPL